MTVKEAREELADEPQNCGECGGVSRPDVNVMEAADDYALVSKLEGHVEACTASYDDGKFMPIRCGDGWYCEAAKAIKEPAKAERMGNQTTELKRI